MPSIAELLSLQRITLLDPGGHLEDAGIMLEVWQRLWREFDVYVEVRDNLICDGSRRSPWSQTKQSRELAKHLVNVGLLVAAPGGYKPSCAEASRCLRGSWLEELGASIALAAGADEVRFGQRLSWCNQASGQLRYNEVDVLARFGESLAFVSCKALTPLCSESSRGADRLVQAIKEVAQWRQRFAAGKGRAILLTTVDFIDESRRRLRNAALSERAGVLGVTLVSADAGDWNGLVDAFKAEFHSA